MKELPGLIWAFGYARHEAPELMEHLTSVATERIADFNGTGLANIAWGCARLNAQLCVQ